MERITPAILIGAACMVIGAVLIGQRNRKGIETLGKRTGEKGRAA